MPAAPGPSDEPQDPRAPKPRTPRPPTKVQASEIQAFLHQHIMRLKGKVEQGEALGEEIRDEANALSNLVRAWDTAADRARIARGKPLPGSNRPVAAKPARSRASQAGPQPVPEAATALSSPVPQPCVASTNTA